MLSSHWIWRNVDGYRIELNSVEKFWGLVRDLQIQKRSRSFTKWKYHRQRQNWDEFWGYSHIFVSTHRICRNCKTFDWSDYKTCSCKIPWRSDQQQAFDELKRLLYKATIEPLHIVDFSKPFDLFVDTSSFAYSAVLSQTNVVVVVVVVVVAVDL